jgi:hypothetical protein
VPNARTSPLGTIASEEFSGGMKRGHASIDANGIEINIMCPMQLGLIIQGSEFKAAKAG